MMTCDVSPVAMFLLVISFIFFYCYFFILPGVQCGEANGHVGECQVCVNSVGGIFRGSPGT